MNWKTFAKALVPTITGLLATITTWIVSGNLDVASLRWLAAGALTAIVVYFVPNAAPATAQTTAAPSSLATPPAV